MKSDNERVLLQCLPSIMRGDYVCTVTYENVAHMTHIT